MVLDTFLSLFKFMACQDDWGVLIVFSRVCTACVQKPAVGNVFNTFSNRFSTCSVPLAASCRTVWVHCCLRCAPAATFLNVSRLSLFSAFLVCRSTLSNVFSCHQPNIENYKTTRSFKRRAKATPHLCPRLCCPNVCAAPFGSGHDYSPSPQPHIPATVLERQPQRAVFAAGCYRRRARLVINTIVAHMNVPLSKCNVAQ